MANTVNEAPVTPAQTAPVVHPAPSTPVAPPVHVEPPVAQTAPAVAPAPVVETPHVAEEKPVWKGPIPPHKFANGHVAGETHPQHPRWAAPKA